MRRRQVIQLGLAASISSLFPSCSRSSTSQFKSADNPPTPVIRFGVIADPQYVDADKAGTRYYRNSVAKLSDSIADFNKMDLDFVVTLGDVIDRDFESYDTMMPLYETCQHPTRFVLGNHDYSVDDEQKKNVATTLGMEKKYFAEMITGVKLIYLDGTDVSLFSDTADSKLYQTAKDLSQSLKSDGKKHIHSYNSAIGQEQLSWLKEELASAEKEEQPVILFCHFPVMPLGSGHNLWNDTEIVELIKESSNVMAYMNGHNHRGAYLEADGTHFLNFKGMVETEKDNAYATVSVYPDRLEIVGAGLEPDRSLNRET